MSEANKTQVAGGHYRAGIQHWDYVVANELNYFEGQITKYVTRCRKKNGLEDLYKARHFLDKYIEVLKQNLEIQADQAAQAEIRASMRE
jgi:hypothetical protein